jgi:hypothetical protein
MVRGGVGVGPGEAAAGLTRLTAVRCEYPTARGSDRWHGGQGEEDGRGDTSSACRSSTGARELVLGDRAVAPVLDDGDCGGGRQTSTQHCMADDTRVRELARVDLGKENICKVLFVKILVLRVPLGTVLYGFAPVSQVYVLVHPSFQLIV